MSDGPMSLRTGLVSHERYLWHDTGTGPGMLPSGQWLQPYHHFDHVDTKRRLRSLLEVSALATELQPLAPREATTSELLSVHTHAHVERMRALSATDGGDCGDGESPFGRGGFDIGALAAGGAIVAVDAVLDGAVRNAYALVRPPGHHALPDTGMGFCMFNNVAVAVRHARARGLARVAVIDWDVHHGNGTEAIFYDDPDVLVVSLHQQDLYPINSGRVADRGAGAGVGANINIPLPAGSGAGAYDYAFTAIVEPAVTSFRPDLILVSCGYDASTFDPLGRMMLHSAAFAELARRTQALADRNCSGRLVALQEGGYSAVYVPFCGVAVLEALSGCDSAVTDPYLQVCLDGPGNALEAHQRAAVDLATPPD